jgi:hypothetical protein
MSQNEKQRPRRDLTTQNNNYQKEQSVPQAERAANTPHEQLVKAFQDFVQEQQQQDEDEQRRTRTLGLGLELYRPPEEILRTAIEQEGISTNRKKNDFWSPILRAWDALAYDRYDPVSEVELMAGKTLYYHYLLTREPVIKLSHPIQVQIIDALTEAVGIPHQKGQAEIKIPEKLKHYLKWIMSKECKERWPKAYSKRDK